MITLGGKACLGLTASSPNASVEAKTTVVSSVPFFDSLEFSSYDEAVSKTRVRGTRRLSIGLGGGLMSADPFPERVAVLSFAVIQCKTRTEKRTGFEIRMC